MANWPYTGIDHTLASTRRERNRNSDILNAESLSEPLSVSLSVSETLSVSVTVTESETRECTLTLALAFGFAI